MLDHVAIIENRNASLFGQLRCASFFVRANRRHIYATKLCVTAL